MLDYAVLASGSNANAYIFKYGELVFAVDNGLSCRQFFIRARQCGFDPEALRYIFITHSHSDHVRGIEQLVKKTCTTVVCHGKMNTSALFKITVPEFIKIEPSREYVLGDLRFTAFRTEHDAPFSLSYSFSVPGCSVCIITDTGIVNEEMVSFANNADILFLEANYCPALLASGDYPEYIKERISSDRGHLSNSAAISFLNELEPGKQQKVYFCHLSGNNNSAGVLRKYLENELTREIDYTICPRGQIVLPKKRIVDHG